ncbi:hypothetical protein CEXT_139491 [Caerostris extrusa]|uniref:Uncharacterized protein n=1 Tax=Caerostris extrusa TaxID=172846 RepID=A0AAV4TCL5_CAEEX|nr:hypothetical protein CEXT_139491 [Caerostris extrusa]
MGFWRSIPYSRHEGQLALDFDLRRCFSLLTSISEVRRGKISLNKFGNRKEQKTKIVGGTKSLSRRPENPFPAPLAAYVLFLRNAHRKKFPPPSSILYRQNHNCQGHLEQSRTGLEGRCTPKSWQSATKVRKKDAGIRIDRR